MLLAPVVAYPQSAEELQRLLEERDATIRQLQERLRASEKPQDDEEMDRALERALVQQGGLVLRAGTYEIEPQLSYAHWDKRRSTLRHASEAALGLRAGLGWDSQFQLRVPYLHVRSSADSETGLGDIGVSLSRQFASERGAWPSLVASVGWLARTGEDGLDGGVPMGGGFNVVQAGFTAVKRRDPLVFFGGLSYAAPQSREISGVRLEPGDTLGVRFGSILAASPETSATVGLNLGFVSGARVDGERVPDSDEVLATLQIGFSTILGRRVLLSLSGDFRLSGDVPDFRLSASLPIRF